MGKWFGYAHGHLSADFVLSVFAEGAVGMSGLGMLTVATNCA
jgi:hypothetical protein